MSEDAVTLAKPAHLVMCRCDQVGWIVYSDGTIGERVHSEAEAERQHGQALGDHKITEEEILWLKQQIRASNLPLVPETIAADLNICYLPSEDSDMASTTREHQMTGGGVTD